MKKHICLLVFLTINSIGAQTKTSDYFTFYKGGDKYLKPIKYVMFDSNLSENIKTEDKDLIYFKIKGERFKFDKKKNKKDSCSLDILKKIKLENPTQLNNEGYKSFKKKKEEIEKEKMLSLFIRQQVFNLILKFIFWKK
ncbi:hypothetical protein CLU81_2890 [Flavobacterium sp. 9]|uniref:hypothetical protein n=1 Tax=Flavobacterium sp. 9 TaxID=2035198 RepID=UPI000C1A35B1|nr:hypothetical protein [Flavobacterium sp. 9]PIF32362.1 hypothetical protein CLU81_2890 [Flavobacterium sp. 9]